MKTSVLYSKTKFYSQYDNAVILNRLQEKIPTQINEIRHEMLLPLYKLCFDSPCSYWNSQAATQVLQQLEALYAQDPAKVVIDEEVFEKFLMGYNAYVQISETLSDMRDFSIAQEIKTRMYRLPTYTSIVEGVLSNFLRVIAVIISSINGMDYATQNSLGVLLSMAEKNGLSEISTKTNVNLRNAINHGKISIQRDSTCDIIHFYYIKNTNKTRKTYCSKMSYFELDDEIDSVYDMVGGVLVALLIFFNNHIEILQIYRTEKSYAAFSMLALELSLPNVQCRNISDTGNNKQLNIEYHVGNTDHNHLMQLSVLIAILVYDKFSDYQKYMISFSSTRMQTGWIRYTREEIADMSENPQAINTCIQQTTDRNDCILFPASTEVVDLNEIKYFTFPTRVTDTYKIINIEDCSLPDRKRLKAHLFVGNPCSRETLLMIIDEALDWLKVVKNPPSPTFLRKHGDMAADALYVNVYKDDTRKSKDILPNNNNFICFVDYNATGKTTLEYGGMLPSIWNEYTHEMIGQKQIAWRDTTYFTRHVVKTGRNELCPCGSGKKHKKCCGK